MQPYDKESYLQGIKTTKEKNKHQANMSTVGFCFVLLLIRKSSFPVLSISTELYVSLKQMNQKI